MLDLFSLGQDGCVEKFSMNMRNLHLDSAVAVVLERTPRGMMRLLRSYKWVDMELG